MITGTQLKASSSIERDHDRADGSARMVQQFRQILVWPLHLMPLREGLQIHHHWELLGCGNPESPWTELADEFSDPDEFQERHYREFVTFLPHVQRFLYGEGVQQAGRLSVADSPIKIYRRRDVTDVRMTFLDGATPILFKVAHVDLYFFYDVDVVMLVFEIFANDLPFDLVQDTMFRFGRAYPSGWTDDERGFHCLDRVEWLDREGLVLATSDYERRGKYLAAVCRQRAPTIAEHWEYLLRPMVPHHSDQKGAIRYRQLEYYRMPFMAYLAMNDSSSLTRADYVRLALVAAPGNPEILPFSARFLDNFEKTYCYDRYHYETGRAGSTDTRVLCCGHAFIMVGSERDHFFIDKERGVLAQFRHQYFLLGLIAHLHKAALLMLSDRLVRTVTRLDITNTSSIRQFRREIRQTLEIFLRFTHRYWFHEVSDQAQARDLFRMWTRHLDTERLFAEVRDELHDMSNYLDSDLLRRQSNTMIRLTVVTIAGLIGTTTTGFLGMNLIAAAEESLLVKVVFFVAVAVPIIALTLYTIVKSPRLSEFLDTLSDERLAMAQKWDSFRQVWKSSRR